MTLSDIFSKMETFAVYDKSLQKFKWTKENRELFRSWLKKQLKRNPSLRNEIMSAPRKINNTEIELDKFSKAFCLSFGVEVI